MPTASEITVLLFAGARATTGQTRLELPASGTQTIADVRRRLAQLWPDLESLLKISRFAVDREFASDDTLVSPDSEIALIPPTSGG